MNPLLRTFFNLCRLRIGPQDLPSSSVLLALTLFTYIAINALLSALSLPPTVAVTSALLDALLMLLITALLLRLTGHPSRILQTMTALAGSGSLMASMAIPVMLWRNHASLSFGDSTLPGLIILLLVIWNILIIGHIFRCALSTLMSIGVLLALFYFWLQIRVINSLIPLPPEL